MGYIKKTQKERVCRECERAEGTQHHKNCVYHVRGERVTADSLVGGGHKAQFKLHINSQTDGRKIAKVLRELADRMDNDHSLAHDQFFTWHDQFEDCPGMATMDVRHDE